jgi:hypothetical protein
MKRILVIGLLTASTAVSAECYMRTQVNLSRQAVFGPPTDVHRIVTPEAGGYRCSLQYRVNVNNQWHNAEGQGTGKTEDAACQQAMDLKNGALLADVTPDRVNANTQMVCLDGPEIKVRRVRIGEQIWESEVDVHTVPTERPYFKFKNTQCRMFVERNAREGNLYTHQGVICRENTTPGSKWLVVAKY